MTDAIPDSNDRGRRATFRGGHVLLDGPVDWPEGTQLHVYPVAQDGVQHSKVAGHIIVAGFGLAGRYVVDLVEQAELPYVVIEKNRATVETQRALGRSIVAGNVADAETLNKARLDEAAILALTIPDEEAVLEATALARRLNPDIYIIARTNYSSKGMRASQLGADEVVKAEQAVAVQFYERLRRQLQRRSDGN